MTAPEAAALVGKPVKIRREKANPGFNTGRLEAVTKDEALVLFKGHKRAEWVPVERIHRWKKGESMAEARSVR